MKFNAQKFDSFVYWTSREEIQENMETISRFSCSLNSLLVHAVQCP
jgi:hypothetical protein